VKQISDPNLRTYRERQSPEAKGGAVRIAPNYGLAIGLPPKHMD